MEKQNTVLSGFVKAFNILTVIGSIVIIVMLSIIILYDGNFTNRPIFTDVQLAVCLIFITDFMLQLFSRNCKWRYFRNNFFFLLISLPYLSIYEHAGKILPQNFHVVLWAILILRVMYGIVIVIKWFTRSNIASLMLSYVSVIVLFTYFASLIFFHFELGKNSMVHHFGDAFWWAWMDVTTVGSNIYAVTAIGKILSVALAASGMMLFPIFTAYIIDLLKKENQNPLP